MKAELRCDQVRPEISAFLDRELTPEEMSAIAEHLDRCRACSVHRDEIARVRSASRVQPSDTVPDLVGDIMTRVQPEPRRSWVPQLRTAAIAAAAAAVVMLGASLPWDTADRPVANAAAITLRVRAAARALDTYRARFRIEETGWHRRIPSRRFTAEVSFDTPERFALSVRDLTEYPSNAWPRNDVDVKANGNEWWIHEPSVCPTAVLPGCVPIRRVEERTLSNRQPFDGATQLPTDIALPLETLSSSDGVRALSRETVLGRTTIRVAVPYQRAIPLVSALQPGGSWRNFHPSDSVEIWLDERTWFPLRFRVEAGAGAGRDIWRRRLGLRPEKPGTTLYQAAAVEFEEPRSIPERTFRVVARGTLQKGRFHPGPFDALTFSPGYVAGLRPYRAGRSPQGHEIASFTKGMTWLKVTRQPRRELRSTILSPAEAVQVGRGVALYEPATSRSGRRIVLFGPRDHFVIESNLPRSELVEVADSLTVRSTLPKRVSSPSGDIERIDPAAAEADAARPSWLPPGFQASAAFVTHAGSGRPSMTAYFLPTESNYGDDAIRIVVDPGVDTLLPSAEAFFSVDLDGTQARFSFERGELEWIEAGNYHSVQVPGSDLATAVRIARGLP